MASFQRVKVLDEMVYIVPMQTLVEGGHRAQAFDDGLAHLVIRRWGTAG